jgi:hypothetical protein
VTITVSTVIDIDGPVELVWKVLLDCCSYGEWKPSPPMRITRTPEVGSKLTVRLGELDGHGMTFNPKVLTAMPYREFRWLGELGPVGSLTAPTTSVSIGPTAVRRVLRTETTTPVCLSL